MTTRTTLVVVFVFVSFIFAQPLFAGNIIIYGEPADFADFTLIDQDNKEFTRSALEKQWSLMFFGYTSCPDVCPTTLSIMQTVLGNIRSKAGNNRSPVKAVFVSLDPVRDTPGILNNYIGYFGDGFIAITGKNNQVIEQLTKDVGINYDFEDLKTHQPIDNISELSPEREYLVNHFAGVFIVDPQARRSAVVFPPLDENDLVKIFNFVYQGYNEDK